MQGVIARLPIFAFGFGNALMLGWLAAAALPIIIHLWNRRRYREVPWAAMEYLLAALRKNARRIRIEQWLLLAVRTLIVIFVVLAMAEPYMERMGRGFIAGTRTLKLFVIDGSYSMAFKPADRSRFERGGACAADRGRQPPGRRFCACADGGAADNHRGQAGQGETGVF